MPPHIDFGPKPRLGYTHSVIDRAAERRHDAAALAQTPGARAYAIGNETIVLKSRGGTRYEPAFTLDEARALGAVAEPVFLGLRDDSPWFGFALPGAAVEALQARSDLFLTDLRSIAVQGLVAPEHLPPIAEAKALLHWHARHRFCANCGQPTEITEGGWRRDCRACSAQHFPRTDPVAIMLTVDGDNCLLGRSARFASTMWSCLAGFVEPGEALEDAVRRETLEEAGILCGEVRYYASQPWPFPSSLMIGCHAQALSRDIKIDTHELEDARWFSRDETAAMLQRRHPDGLSLPPPVAIAHHIIRTWLEDDVTF
jgi:NAD+ diphosphatase